MVTTKITKMSPPILQKMWKLRRKNNQHQSDFDFFDVSTFYHILLFPKKNTQSLLAHIHTIRILSISDVNNDYHLSVWKTWINWIFFCFDLMCFFIQTHPIRTQNHQFETLKFKVNYNEFLRFQSIMIKKCYRSPWVYGISES